MLASTLVLLNTNDYASIPQYQQRRQKQQQLVPIELMDPVFGATEAKDKSREFNGTTFHSQYSLALDIPSQERQIFLENTLPQIHLRTVSYIKGECTLMKAEFCTQFADNPNCKTLFSMIFYILNESRYYLPVIICTLHQSLSFTGYEVGI